MQDQETYKILLRDLEQIDDVEQLARTLHEDGLQPNGDPRLEALFRRAMRGKGFYSQLLAAYCEPA
jgi:hypothetical protein